MGSTESSGTKPTLPLGVSTLMTDSTAFAGESSGMTRTRYRPSVSMTAAFLSIAGASLDTVADRKYPVGCVGLGRVGELVCGYFVEARLRRRTNKAVVLRVGHGTRLPRIGGNRIPPHTIGPIEAQGLRNVFDGGALLVRKIGRFRDPEEVGCDPLGKCGAVPLLRDFSELFAKSVEARITRSFRKGNRNRLVRNEGRRGRLRGWSCRNRCLGGGFGLGEDKIPLDCAYHRDRNDEAQTKT